MVARCASQNFPPQIYMELLKRAGILSPQRGRHSARLSRPWDTCYMTHLSRHTRTCWSMCRTTSQSHVTLVEVGRSHVTSHVTVKMRDNHWWMPTTTRYAKRLVTSDQSGPSSWAHGALTHNILNLIQSAAIL